MEIRNVTQFNSFITSNGLSNLDPTFGKVGLCLAEFSRHCNCRKGQDKNKIYANCNSLYIIAAKTAASSFRHQFLEKIPDKKLFFYTESGSLISSC